MIKHILSFIIIATATSVVWSQQRSEQEMLDIARKQLSTHTSSAKRIKGSGEGEVKAILTRDAFSMYAREGAGFVIVSSESRMSPILAYGSDIPDPQNLPCGMQWWMEEMETQTQKLKESKLFASASSQTYIPVENILAAQWGQEKPYNRLCPEISGKQPPTGCVATAMAQILYFYRYPAAGKGTGRYSLGNETAKMSAEISSTYAWDLMVDKYKRTTASEESQNAVATLMRDCGYGCYMNYSLEGSGSYINDCTRSFIDNFSYNPASIRIYYRDYFSNDEWMQMIQDELMANRPILYAGSDKDHGGHAFIFSGIREDGLVYVNWGWDGSADGYYDIRSLNPTGILGTSYPYAFIEQQQMVVGIKAEPGSGDGESEETFIAMDAPFTAKAIGNSYIQCVCDVVYNIGYRVFVGEIGFFFVSDDGDVDKNVFFATFDNRSSGTPFTVNSGERLRTKLVSVSSIVPGEYHLYMAARPTQSDHLEIMRTVGGIYSIPVSKSADGTVSFEDGYIVDAISPITISLGEERSESISRVYDATGRLVYSAPSSHFNPWNVPAHGILVVKEGNKVRKIVR